MHNQTSSGFIAAAFPGVAFVSSTSDADLDRALAPVAESSFTSARGEDECEAINDDPIIDN